MRKATQQRQPCPAPRVKIDAHAYESRIGIHFEEDAVTKSGYLANCKPTTHTDQNGAEVAALLLYFIQDDGSWFKALKIYEPYFLVECSTEVIQEIIFYLNKTYEEKLKSVDVVDKEDLELVNHLSGKTGKFLRLSFKNVQDLSEVKYELLPIVEKNKLQRETQEAYEGWYNPSEMAENRKQSSAQFLSKIIDIREFDVAYHIRCMIDNEIRCSFWYEVSVDGPLLRSITHLSEKLDKADLRVLAFDIETTKAPLKFPDSKFDQVMMISYIIDGKGFLITNRQIVGDDVQDFEYSPKPEYDVGQFKVFNEPDEKALLIKFFDHIRETKPCIFTTFNGDYFDWPFIQDRAEYYQLKIEEEIGIYNSTNQEVLGRFAAHLDCLYWVKRDAYLPQGSHGLKAVTKAKLGYDPVELDPELMLPYAQERPQELAEYSVSDAVATYFLYKKMIHDFIFALCTIIPTYPDEVLRRGSGTLCENLLMAQAFRGNIIFPNKQKEIFERFHNSNLIDTDTYIGGTVECLQRGVYRSDIPVKFKLAKDGYQRLINEADDVMKFAIQIESNANVEDVTNYEAVKAEIIEQLTSLRDRCPFLESEPLIYHVDVAAMYPNIILSNRLQPVAIVNEQVCAGCVFNKEENNCKRNLEWQWRGEMFPLSRKEFERIKNQLEYDEENQPKRDKSYQMRKDTQTYQEKLKQRVKKYCQTVYKQVHVKKTELKTDTVCMRENPFYVDTVRDFRDRRYEFKRLVKVWTAKFKEAQKAEDPEAIETAKNRMSLYESLQLAHKIILNSFYGYVMKKGARWYSMEMAAMVTHTGGSIITDSRQLFDQIGMPLELDTDGIWTLLPKGFPENFTFTLNNGKKVNFDFPCTMCNNLIYDKYGNKQYQTLINKERLEYETRNEMSVFFEIDGPYRCMLIPASREEGKMLKKRYAVFNHAGKMTEVKGFELKRRGELKIIKIFQQEVFDKFLEGKTLQECYDACGEVGERWFDILDSKGEYVDAVELIDYIGEERVLSKGVHEYGDKKGTSITCAKRLAEFLGDEILKDDGGLNVKFIISKNPIDGKVADRAIPTAIFEADPQIMQKYLKRWLKDNSITNFDIRNILDWDYYKERLGGSIQKIVTIPAALQKCMNPVPKIEYPEWLHKRIKANDDKFKQKDMKHFFKVMEKPQITEIEDLETMGVINPLKAMQISQQKKEKEANKQSKEKYSKMQDCPDPSNNANFSEWIKYQKNSWRRIRQNFKENKQVVNTAALAKTNLGLSNFMRNMDDVVLNSNWHIISIQQQSNDSGIMKAWVSTENSTMFPIKLRIPRIIYINSKTESTDKDFRKVNNKILPRNRKLYNLYEWETTEEIFQEKFHSITYNHLLSNNIEGIYETKMPLKFRAINELGCLIRPRKNKIPKNEQALGRIYSLNELEIKSYSMQDSPYLPSHSFEKIYLLHFSHQSKHVFGFYNFATKVCNIAVVNPAAQKKQDNADSILQLTCRNTLRQGLQELELEAESTEWEVGQSWETKELRAACQHIEKCFHEFKQRTKTATLVLLQSRMTPEALANYGLKTMALDFPVIRVPNVQEYNIFPALAWTTHAYKNMTMQFAELEDWLNHRITLSRYSLIPLGNLEQDCALSVVDNLFARNLSLNKHVLWYSNSSNPDLGGHEDQDFRSFFQDEIENPELIQKGFYRGYTVEIEIQELAINTILQSEFLKEFEEATMTAQQNIGAVYESKSKNQQNQHQSNFTTEFDTDLDEFVTCSQAFKKLKELVTSWYDDFLKDDSSAQHLLLNVYRWLSSPKTSKLYDPLLHRLVHKLMKKNFFQLLLRFKQLGCRVIYANFNSIWVYTEKKTFAEAESHINFVLQNLKTTQLFQYMTLTPAEYWSILLFKDAFNFAGIKESDPSRVNNRWDIVLHLPAVTQKKFLYLTAEFILKVSRHNQKLHRQSQAQGQQEKDQQAAQAMLGLAADQPTAQQEKTIANFMDAVDDIKKEDDHDFVSKLITQYFSHKIFDAVTDFIMKKSNEEIYQNDVVSDNDEDDDYGYEDQQEDDYEDEPNQQKRPKRDRNQFIEARKRREKDRQLREIKRWEFPQRIGSYQQYVIPALEFSKFITQHVFGLDEAFYQEAHQMKVNLLRMIHCKEFSQEVQGGVEPSLVLVIPDVICDNCQKCVDLDICREPTLNSDLENRVQDEEDGKWRCSACSASLNKLNIERRLLDLANRRLISYQMQDLKCTQCAMVKNSIVSKYCDCTGAYAQTIGNEQPDKLRNQNLLNQMTDIKLFMQLLRNFASYHNLTILKDTTDQILQVFN